MNIRNSLWFVGLRGLAVGFLLTFLGVASVAAQTGEIAVRAERLYTSAGAPIDDAVVIIRDGKIKQVGPAARISIPSGLRVLDAAVVTPGLIDAHTVVGMVGYLSQPSDQDQLERSAPIQPELRAIDAYNAREPLVAYLRSYGITLLHTGHGPGEIVSGQTLLAKTVGRTVDDAVYQPFSMVAATLGAGALARTGGPSATPGRKSPGTRAKVAAMLRSALVAAAEYSAKVDAAGSVKDKQSPPRDLKLETLVQVLNGDVPLMITAHRHNDIMTALRIAQEFDIRVVLDGAAEAYLLVDEIRDAGVGVIIHPAMARANGERENLSFTTAAKLLDAGIEVALQSGYEGYVPKTRVVLFEAAVLLAHGLSFQQALDTITINAARILGVANQVGSIEIGKDGDLALYDGDPFEYTSHAIGTIIAGDLVSEQIR